MQFLTFGGLPFIGRGQARGHKNFEGAYLHLGTTSAKKLGHQCSRVLYSSPRGCGKTVASKIGHRRADEKIMSKNPALQKKENEHFADLMEKTFVPSGRLVFGNSCGRKTSGPEGTKVFCWLCTFHMIFQKNF